MYNGILTPDLSRLTLKVYTLPRWSAVGGLVLLQCTATELKVQVGPRGNEGLRTQQDTYRGCYRGEMWGSQ